MGDVEAEAAGGIGGDRTDRHDHRWRFGAERLGPAGRGRPAGEHDGVDGAQPLDLVSVRRADDRAVGSDRLDGVTGGGQPVGEHAPGTVGLGDEHTGGRRRELGEQSFGLGDGRHEVDGPAGSIGQRRRRGRPDRGESQRRMRGGGRTDAHGTVDRRDDEPVERVESSQRRRKRGHVGDLDERDVDDGRAEGGEAIGERARLRAGERDARASRQAGRRRRAGHVEVAVIEPQLVHLAADVPLAGEEREQRAPRHVGADRERASGAELLEERPLDLDGVPGRGVVDRGHRAAVRGGLVVDAGTRRRRIPGRRPARTARRAGARRRGR